MLERTWFSLNGRVVDLEEEIVKLTQDPGKMVLIGTDSQKYEKRIDFVTAVIVRTPMKGGRVFYTREKDPRFYNLRDKLIQEAYMSIQVAWEIKEILPEHTAIAALHADVNTDIKKGQSAKYENEVCGMITAQGFQVVTKPEAWAAQHVAEHVVKNRHEKYYEDQRKAKRVAS